MCCGSMLVLIENKQTLNLLSLIPLSDTMNKQRTNNFNFLKYHSSRIETS